MLAIFVLAQLGYLAAVLFMQPVFRRSDSPVPTPVHAAVYLWHFLVMPGALLAIAISALFRRTGGVIAHALHSRPPRDLDAPLPTRRQFIGAAAVAAAPLVMAGLSGIATAQIGELRVRRFRIALAQLPPELEGLTITHVSDLHVGKFTRPSSLAKITETVNSLRSDFVLVTGDLIDLALADLPQSLGAIRAMDPQHGLLICEGNHDLVEDPSKFRASLRASGFPFLWNSERTIEFRGRAVQFFGVPWEHGYERIVGTVTAVKPLIRPDAFPILMAHHPHAFDGAAAAGIPLTLSGHTHGGQLMLNERLGFGPAMFKYWSGLYRRESSALVVSNGTGNWFPLRVNAPAEIVHITLCRP